MRERGREGEKGRDRGRGGNKSSGTCKEVFLPVKLCFVFDFCSWERVHDLWAGRVEADVHHFLTFVL